MSYGYDEEAIYQDADIETWELENEARHLDALRRSGVCTHDSTVGLGSDGKAHYPEAEGLKPGERRCTAGCGEVFASDEDYEDALRALH